jgi:muramoyltetrapeptide carboxypeptidase
MISENQHHLFPQPLKQGDRIRIVCTARAVVLDEILPAAEWIRNLGFRVEYGETIGQTDGQFGGSDEQRATDLQNAINDDGIRAIWCARGGYGTIRILDKIDFEPLKKNPKWIIGFSDITALHVALFRHGLVSLHAPMPITFNRTSDTSVAFGLLLSYLMGNYTPLTWEKSANDVAGIAQGRIFGGNLSVLYSLRGTPFDTDTKQTLFFVEDIDEYLYHIDRMVNNFHHGGRFRKVAGLISGQFTKMNDNTVPFGHTPNDILARYAEKNKVPVQSYNSPFGHLDYNLPLLHGATATLEVGTKNVMLSYHG